MKVEVAARVKPMSNHERLQWKIEEETGTLIDQSGTDERGCDRSWKFDTLLGPSSSNVKVYEETCARVVQRVFEGGNGTIMTYGQSKSGKTHTLFGMSPDKGRSGIALLGIKNLFLKLETSLRDFELANPSKTLQFFVGVSYFDIYNEKIRDLLTGKDNLQILEDGEGGIMVNGLKELVCSSCDHVEKMIQQAESFRKYNSRGKKAILPRSHSILRVNLERRVTDKETGGLFENTTSTMLVVDLAGGNETTSGKFSSVDGRSEDMIREGSNLNRSLVTLRRILKDLQTNKSGEGVAFRESKLTRILAPSLIGNSYLSILFTLSLARDDRNDTIFTLDFAEKCGFVNAKTKPWSPTRSGKKTILVSGNPTAPSATKNENNNTNNQNDDDHEEDDATSFLSDIVALDDQESCLTDYEDGTNSMSVFSMSESLQDLAQEENTATLTPSYKARLDRLSEIVARNSSEESKDLDASFFEEGNPNMSMDNLTNEIDLLLLDSHELTDAPPRFTNNHTSIEKELDSIRFIQNDHMNRYEEKLKEIQARLELEAERRRRVELELELERQNTQKVREKYRRELSEAAFERNMLQRSLIMRQEHLENVGSQITQVCAERADLSAKLHHLEDDLRTKEESLRDIETEIEMVREVEHKKSQQIGKSINKAFKVLGLDDPTQSLGNHALKVNRRKSALGIFQSPTKTSHAMVSRRLSLTPSFRFLRRKSNQSGETN